MYNRRYSRLEGGKSEAGPSSSSSLSRFRLFAPELEGPPRLAAAMLDLNGGELWLSVFDISQ